MSKSHIIFLIGPTAAGKTAAALALAKHWPIEIIVMDSATIYRDMDIGTAKSSAKEQALVKHHLLDIVDPAQSYDVATFVHDCLRHLRRIEARQRYTVICGGTMMYYQALTQGLSPFPKADPEIRKQLAAQAQDIGWPSMHQQLQKIDPATAKRVSPNDSQRIQRALEVFHLTKTPLSELQQQPRQKKLHHPFTTISLEPKARQELHPRIKKRFHQMLDKGFLDEVKALYQRPDLHLNLPSIRCVGYRQLWLY